MTSYKKHKKFTVFLLPVYLIRSVRRNLFLRHIYYRISSSLMLKMTAGGFVLMLTLSWLVYFIENKRITYRDTEGIHIEEKAGTGNIRSFEDSIWWAVVTSTTVGYGDRYPVSTPGRVMAVLLMFFGVSLVGVVTGNIASFLVDKQLKEERGLKTVKMKNHFIICGWKRDMARVLKDILHTNIKFIPSQIVLINTAGSDEIEIIKDDPELSGVTYIHGDYIDETVLKKANIKQAKKILILADRLISGSVQEVDSRTVMSIITVKALSKTIYAAAELLDSKFERYLLSANCDEIILTSDYNRSLIAHASTGSGISHVVNELLNVDASVSINTLPVPAPLIGKRYGALSEHYRNVTDKILLGILENTGNFHQRKMEAIEEAQKAPDISTLVDRLKTVKSMTANRPVINPSDDYIINKNCKVIIIEGKGS